MPDVPKLLADKPWIQQYPPAGLGSLLNPMPLIHALGHLPGAYANLMQQGGAGLADMLVGQSTTPMPYNPQDHVNAMRGIAIDHANAMKEIARESEPAESRPAKKPGAK